MAMRLGVYTIALILSSFSLPLAVSKLVSARVAKKEYKNAMAIFKGSILFAIGVGLLAALVVFFGADFFADKVMASAPVHSMMLARTFYRGSYGSRTRIFPGTRFYDSDSDFSGDRADRKCDRRYF